MKIEIGQKVVSRSGFVFEVVKIARGWITCQGKHSGAFDHYTEKDFIGRFGDQLPKEKPKQGELM